jgi:hypothetical protein
MADCIVSTDATAISPPVVENVPCAHCGAPLALDQRYCLECGARRTEARSQFLDGLGAPAPSPPGVPAARAPGDQPHWGGASAIAGVGVLLLAMGVGVLIGRSGSGKTVTAPAQVVSVTTTPGASIGAGATNTPAAAQTGSVFSADWPAGKNGYTVQLQTLQAAATQPSEVAAAKTAASAKGAQGVGALRSDGYRGLPTGLYVIYSGVYSSAAQAKQAIGGLKAKFPGAVVIHVDGGSKAGAGGGGSSSGTGSTPGGGGSSNTPSTPTSAPKSSGQSNEQKSLHLPNVVSTG